MRIYYSNINNFIDNTQDLAENTFEDRYRRYLEKISIQRREHLLRFKGESDRLRSLAGTLLLSYAIANYNGQDVGENHTPSTITFDESVLSDLPIIEYDYIQNGKPAVPHYPDIRFSVSHSGELAALVIADHSECEAIGIDIQKMDRKNIEKIAGRFYTPSEQKYIQAKDNEEYGSAFYKIWSAKEAFIKCTGEGLKRDMTSFSIDLDKQIVKDTNTNKIIAKIKQQECPVGYSCCVCMSCL